MHVHVQIKQQTTDYNDTLIHVRFQDPPDRDEAAYTHWFLSI
jgi:hypothetical protein